MARRKHDLCDVINTLSYIDTLLQAGDWPPDVEAGALRRAIDLRRQFVETELACLNGPEPGFSSKMTSESSEALRAARRLLDLLFESIPQRNASATNSATLLQVDISQIRAGLITYREHVFGPS